jgi:glutathione S-transferase
MEALWRRRPRLRAWLERVAQRPNFARAVTKWFTDEDRERFTVDRDAVNRALKGVT